MAKAAAVVEAAIAGEAKLDAHRLRADFPIFEQRFHGKPLAYLDSAVSAQKPRQVLDALREFYETSYTSWDEAAAQSRRTAFTLRQIADRMAIVSRPRRLGEGPRRLRRHGRTDAAVFGDLA